MVCCVFLIEIYLQDDTMKLEDIDINAPFFSRIFEKQNALHSDKNHTYLYKYLRFDDEKYVLGVINNNTIKYSRPDTFNDPYDCLYNVAVDFSDFNKETYEKEYQCSMTEDEWLINKESIYELLKNHHIKQVSNARNLIGVSCFTSNPLNILMWSHYAENHTGFVVEFKIPKGDIHPFGPKTYPLPIKYTEEFPTFTLPWNINKSPSQNLLTEMTEKLILTKAKEWSYENEFRSTLMHPDFPPNGLSKYDPAILSGVIIGSRTGDDEKKDLINAVADFNKKFNADVAIYNCQLEDNAYRLKLSPSHPILDKKQAL